MYLAGLDVGASEIKASIFDLSGREIASVRRDCKVEAPAPGWAQSPPEVLMKWPPEVLGEAVSNSGLRADEIAAVGVTGSRATVLPMTRSGDAVGPAILWYDRRAQAVVETLSEELGSNRFFQITGVPLDPTPSVTKMIWLRQERPQRFAAAEVFALPQTVVLHTLIGSEWYCDDSYGPYYGLMDLATKRWSDELLDATAIPVGVLPKLVAPGTILGAVSASATEVTGLNPGTQVIASGSDAACFKLGIGVGGKGVAGLHIATAAAVGVISDMPVLDPRLTCCPSALPDCWDVDALLLTGGSAYRWLRDLLGSSTDGDAGPTFADLDSLAASIPVGSEGVIIVPHLAGAGTPLWNPQACGIIFGLRLSHGPGHLSRAVLEGVAFALRHALEALQDAGSAVESLQLTGGGSRSELWGQILADVTSIPISVPSGAQSTSLGAAMMAGLAVGMFPDHATAISAMSSAQRRYDPDETTRDTYEMSYRKYLDILTQMHMT
jgi:xylulokinase